MYLNYNDKAAEKGVYVVGSCGFDSIPADMGVLYTRNNLKGNLYLVTGVEIVTVFLFDVLNFDQAQNHGMLVYIPNSLFYVYTPLFNQIGFPKQLTVKICYCSKIKASC